LFNSFITNGWDDERETKTIEIVMPLTLFVNNNNDCLTKQKLMDKDVTGLHIMFDKHLYLIPFDNVSTKKIFRQIIEHKNLNDISIASIRSTAPNIDINSIEIYKRTMNGLKLAETGLIEVNTGSWNINGEYIFNASYYGDIFLLGVRIIDDGKTMFQSISNIIDKINQDIATGNLKSKIIYEISLGNKIYSFDDQNVLVGGNFLSKLKYDGTDIASIILPSGILEDSSGKVLSESRLLSKDLLYIYIAYDGNTCLIPFPSISTSLLLKRMKKQITS
jgi:hypothetical protein